MFQFVKNVIKVVDTTQGSVVDNLVWQSTN